jgi:hypothetical protein
MKTPGAIATTLIPNFPKSLVIGLTIQLIALFEANYAAYLLKPSSATSF